MSIQNEYSSFKLLLKQLYSAHTTKIKELENEIKDLKEKLIEKEREISYKSSECKRCVELEEAFKSCKKALHDQSKLFESFGQKFSIFNSSQLGSQESKSASKLPNCTSETDRFSRSLKNNKTFYERNETSMFLLGDDTMTENKINVNHNMAVISNNQNLLKKVMCDDENLESLDACTVTFPEHLKDGNIVKPDSLILAPDSLDTSPIIKNESKAELKESHSKCHKSKKTFNFNGGENLREIEKSHPEIKASNKRLSDSVNEERVKRCNTGNQVENCSKTGNVKPCDFQVPKIVVSNDSKQAEVKAKTFAKESNAQNGQVSKKKNIAAEVIVSKDNKNEVSKNFVNVSNGLKNKLNQVSPSLLPKTVNVVPKIIDLEYVSTDDDFQELAPTKSVESEDSWDSCDKKKLRKNKLAKSIKTTSKYKMTLVAPSNYKKPNFKQTKLSKTLFKPKEVDLNQKSPTSNQDVEVEMIEDNSFPTVLKDHFQTSTQCGLTKSPFTFDIDATFIPENFKFENSPCATSSVKKNAVEKSNFKNGGLFSNISFPEELNPSARDEDSYGNENEINDQSSYEDAELKENVNSFDRLPLPEEPNYKYKNDVVRKQSERRQLNGFDCKECEKYYSELGLTDKEKKNRMKKCSRHRGKFTPPATPEHFWELDFPDTEECKARGYMNATQKVKLNNICNI